MSATNDPNGVPGVDPSQAESPESPGRPSAKVDQGWGFLASLLAGLGAAKLAGLALYLISAGMTRDPKGSGLLVAQILYLVVRGVGGYVAVILRRRSVFGLTIALAVLDIGSMLGLLAILTVFGMIPDQMKNGAGQIDLVAYGFEFVGAIPGYAIGAVLAWTQRRYLGVRTKKNQAAGFLQRFVFQLFGALFYLAGGLICIIAFVVLYQASGPRGGPLNSVPMWMATFGAFAAAGVGSGMVAFGKRLIAAATPPLVGLPDIVLLREFRQDQIQFASKNSLTTFQPYGDRSLEDILVRVARRYGQVAAIGDPTEPLPRTGAARTYFESDDNVLWRQQASAYIDGSQALIVMLGSGNGLRWEYGRIAECGALGRTILVVPPGGPYPGWEVFRETLAEKGITGLPESIPPDALLVRFTVKAQPRVYKASSRDADVYAIRLKQAFLDRTPDESLNVKDGEFSEVPEVKTFNLVTWIGVILMGGLGGMYGAGIGFIGLLLLTRGAPDTFGWPGWTIALSSGALIGLWLGIRKGRKIKRFA